MRGARRGTWVGAVMVTVGLFGLPSAQAATGLSVATGGSNGSGTFSPGLACAGGGSGETRTTSIAGPLAPGVFSALPSTLNAHLEIHTDPALIPTSGGHDSFLAGPASLVAIENTRGFVDITLNDARPGGGIGLCPGGSTTFNRATSTATGSGAWTVTGGVGSYRSASGSGAFALTAALAPGAANAWSIQLNGTVSVLRPSLGVTVASTSWGNLGLDYLSRIVTVVYRVANAGAGDAYGVRLVSSSGGPGVTSLGPAPQAVGDIPAGGATFATLRYRLGLLQPCALVVLDCHFTTTTTFSVPDALDAPATQAVTAAVRAPDLPPPL